MDLKYTASMMCSPDFKERFRAEYFQLQHRTAKLEELLNNYRIGKLDFTPNCSYELLYEQLIFMKQYQRVLEAEAKVQNISLSVDMHQVRG